jgi:dolichyl-phosphate beta-glucosyltransferase
MSLVIIGIVTLILILIAYFIFIHTAQKEYDKRRELKGHQPKLYKYSGEFTYDKKPLYSKTNIDNIILSLVFPAYNEENRLIPALEKSLNYFNSLNLKYEIIITNDGSKDKTFEVVQNQIQKYKNIKNSPDIILASYPLNGGKGYAVRTGMQFVRGKYILMLDSDGATDVRDFQLLFDKIKDEDKALAIGSRKIISEKAERVWYRNIMGVVNNIFVRYLIGIKDIKDTQCGFKLFTRKAAQIIFKNLHLVRWAFDVEMLYIAQHSDIKVMEIPVNWKEIPGSKLRIVSATISFFRDYFAMITYYNLGYWKIEKDFDKN